MTMISTKRNYKIILQLLIISLLMSFASFYYNKLVLNNNLFGDQYVVGMMAMKNIHPELYKNDFLFSNSDNYKYYNPVFVKILELIYGVTNDVVYSTQLLNSALVFAFIFIYSLLVYKVTRRLKLSIMLTIISSATVVSIIEGELWGFFISYNSSARGVYTILLLFLLLLLIYLKNDKNFKYYLPLILALFGLSAAIHPPTGLSAGFCIIIFLSAYKLLNVEFVSYKWIVISILLFFVFFVISSVMPFRSNVNPFNSNEMNLRDYFFIYEFLNTLRNDTLKFLIFSILDFIPPLIINLIHITASILMYILLRCNTISIKKYFVLTGVINLPFVFFALSLPIIHSLSSFPIAPQLFSLIGFIPVIIYMLFVILRSNNLNNFSINVQLAVTSLIISTFGLSIFFTLYVKFVNKDMAIYVASSLRGMRFFYIIIPIILFSIFELTTKKYIKSLYVVLALFLCYQIVLQDNLYRKIPENIVKIFIGSRTDDFSLKWENSGVKKPNEFIRTAVWLKTNTDIDAIVLFVPEDYYTDTPKLKCLSERSFVIDQSAITQYTRYLNRSNDYKQLVSGNFNIYDYIKKYKPEFIVREKKSMYLKSLDYTTVYENDFYQIYKVNEKL